MGGHTCRWIGFTLVAKRSTGAAPTKTLVVGVPQPGFGKSKDGVDLLHVFFGRRPLILSSKAKSYEKIPVPTRYSSMDGDYKAAARALGQAGLTGEQRLRLARQQCDKPKPGSWLGER